MNSIKLGKAILKMGNNPDCIHEDIIGWSQEYKRDLIGVCRKCGRVVDYGLLQNGKHLMGEYPNKVYSSEKTEITPWRKSVDF